MQGCACTHGDHQLTRFIADDALQRTHIQHIALQAHAMKVFAAATANPQGGSIANSSAYALEHLVKGGIHGAQSYLSLAIGGCVSL